MKYNIYFKETSRLSNVTKFRDGKLLISYEGKWKNNPSVNQNLDIFITSDEKWEMDSAIIRKRDIEIYAGFMSANKEKYSKIVMTNDQEFNRCSKTLPITNDILDWICNNLESKEIPIEKVSINIINKGMEELYRIKASPMIFMEDAKITGITHIAHEDSYKGLEEQINYMLGCDPIDDDSKQIGFKLYVPVITEDSTSKEISLCREEGAKTGSKLADPIITFADTQNIGTVFPKIDKTPKKDPDIDFPGRPDFINNNLFTDSQALKIIIDVLNRVHRNEKLFLNPIAWAERYFGLDSKKITESNTIEAKAHYNKNN